MIASLVGSLLGRVDSFQIAITKHPVLGVRENIRDQAVPAVTCVTKFGIILPRRSVGPCRASNGAVSMRAARKYRGIHWLSAIMLATAAASGCLSSLGTSRSSSRARAT